MKVTESDVEDAALEWLEALGWRIARSPDIAPDSPGAERADYGDVVLERRLRDALARLNPGLPASALDDAFRKLLRPDGTTTETRNRAVHRLLVNGATVELLELEPLESGGAAIFAQRTGHLPGLRGRLNPIPDTSDRTYLYADNIAIDEGRQQPVPFRPGKPMRLTDAHGSELSVTIVDILGRSALIEYEPFEP